ncbi:zinc knuckle [Cooperia oncophora]
MAKACRSKASGVRKVSRRVNWCAEPSTSDLDECDSSENNIDRLTHRERQGRREELVKSKHQARRSEGVSEWQVGRSAETRRSADRKSCLRVRVEPATMLKIKFMVQTSRANWIPEPRRIGKPPLTEATIEATAYNNSPIKFCAFCSNCSRPGHMAKACRSKASGVRKVSRRVNWCAEPSTSDLDECDSSENNIDRLTHRERQGRREELVKSKHQARRSEGVSEWQVGRSAETRRSADRKSCLRVRVEPATMLKIKFMVQTSRANWIPEPRRIGKPPLTEATIEATAYNNSPIKFCGKCTKSRDGFTRTRTTRSLCGRDMIRALRIDCGPHYQSIHEMQEKPLPKPEQKLAKIIEDNDCI